MIYIYIFIENPLMFVFNKYLRWFVKSFYVYGCGQDLPGGLKRNGNLGCTISFKKRGGIDAAWKLAKECAKWD